jgi:hypothetical protein
MASMPGLARGGDAAPAIGARSVILAALAAVALLQLHLVFTKSFNWDEFYHFGQIYELREGRLAQVLQTFHARFLGWAIHVPGDTIAKMQAARFELWLLGLAVAAAVYGTARRFASDHAALLAALAWLSGGYAFLHSFSIRPDTIAAAALMGALWLIATRRLTPAAALLAGALAALALMATIKTVFYVPPFVAIAWLRWREDELRGVLVRFAALAAVACAATFALLYAWHAPAVMPTPAGTSGAVLGDSSSRMFAEGLFPRGRFLLAEIAFAPVLTAMILLAPGTIREARLGSTRAWILAGLALPLASVAVYANAFPYFYAFILPPVAVALAPAIERYGARFGYGAIAGALLLNAALLDLKEPKAVLPRQRAVIAGIKQVFPQPVWYFDEPGVVGDYRHATTWMTSGWGLKKYRERGRPELSEFAANHVVPFALAKGPALESALTGAPRDEQFLSADRAMLRDNYIPHWGLLHVAGKVVPAGPAPLRLVFAVPGTYTVEAAPMSIDGAAYASGALVTLTRGPHTIGGNRGSPGTLRWGDHLPVPTAPFPDGALFTTY